MVARIWQQSVGDGADLVVLHGWGLNAAIWQPWLTQLTNHYRVHLVDLPGFGESPWPADQEVSLANYTRWLAAALPSRFHLLGWSLGGVIATDFALRFPDRVKSLTTLASSPYFVAADDWPGMQAQVLANFQQQLAADYRKTVERFIAIQALGSPNAKLEAKQMKQLVMEKPQPSQVALAGGLTLLAEADLRDRLPQLQVPLWRVYGRLDTLVPARTAASVDALHPASTSLMLMRSAHAPFLTEPDKLTEHLKAFTHQYES